MKTLISSLIAILLLLLVAILSSSCGKSCNCTQDEEPNLPMFQEDKTEIIQPVVPVPGSEVVPLGVNQPWLKR